MYLHVYVCVWVFVCIRVGERWIKPLEMHLLVSVSTHSSPSPALRLPSAEVNEWAKISPGECGSEQKGAHKAPESTPTPYSAPLQPPCGIWRLPSLLPLPPHLHTHTP